MAKHDQYDRRFGRAHIGCSFVLAAVLLVVVGCAGNKESAQPYRPTLNQLASEQLANYFPKGSVIPPPSTYEQGIMAKETLTFSDYDAAMQATAHCEEKALPGIEAVMTPEPNNPQILDLSLQTPNASPGRQATGNETSPSSTQSSPTASSDTATTVPAGTTTTPPPPPPVDQGTQTAIGTCIAEYSALVSARWMLAGDTLPTTQIGAQKTAFLHCVASAGLHLSSSISNGDLARMFGNAAVYNGMGSQESGAVSTCVSDFPRLMLTIGA